MDYSALVSRGWRITWANKWLWILGFLAGLTRSSGGSSNGFQYSSSGTDSLPQLPDLARFAPVVVGLVCLVLVLALVFWLLGLVAKGGLISAVARLDAGEKVSFSEAFGAGTGALGRLVGVSIILNAPILVLIIMAVATVAATSGAAIVSSLTSDPAAMTPESLAAGFGFALICLLALICVLVPLAILINFIAPFAMRGVMLGNLGVSEAIGHGWQVLRRNFVDILLLAILFLVINFVFSLAVGIVLVPVALVMFAPMFGDLLSGAQPSLEPIQLAWLVGGAFCLGVLAALLNSLLTTWQSATFTLAYQQFLGKEADA